MSGPPDPEIRALLERNVAWARQRTLQDPDYFRRLVALQAPRFFWIGCADSRVPANVITGLEPGEVFVHRNVANLVNPSDLNMLAALQYAVEVLRVRHVIVCGHYGCGGVRAAVDGRRHGLIDHWLEPIRDVARAHADELAGIGPDERRLERLCELVVRAQVARVPATPTVKDARRSGQLLSVHGWVYGLEDGLIRDLGVTAGAA